MAGLGDGQTGLARAPSFVMVLPDPKSAEIHWDETAPLVTAVLTRRVRLGLVAIAAGLVSLFALALWIDPYGSDGRPRTMGTHRQLGLPECNFLRLTGYPCPSCGMTTSFALLVRGDVVNSLRANCAGTLLALTLLATIPWTVVCAIRARWLWVRSVEPWILWIVIVVVGIAIVRWGLIVGLAWLRR
jgi:hypothetical protein